jgi:UDP-N-acetylglucosamine/UDP-N-acetylgalactosamine diphosphorylase
MELPEDLKTRLQHYGQAHVIAAWDRLTPNARPGLLEQLRGLDLELLYQLYTQREKTFALPTPESIRPVPIRQLSAADKKERSLGEEALRRGEVAVLMVAGGQGSRLGFEHPKGMFATGPVSNNSLFQIHAEKVLALRRRYGRAVPFLILTSHATHDETAQSFADHHFFGLSAEEVFFFQQGTMPALDQATGQLLFEAPGRLFLSPNGHGGTLTALADSGLLDRLRAQAIRQIFYFQVDNPLVKIADALFLGHHLAERAEVSSKIVPKETPSDKLGNLVLVNGRCAMIEYSDLPDHLARETDEKGALRIRAGSPAIHIFGVDFLGRVTQGQTRMPYHVARKIVPHVDASGKLVQPERENALKFELFIFDALPLTDRWTVVETSRREEFAPLKNATGADSPEQVRQAISDLAGDWLERAGVEVPRRADGSAAVPLEVSPLYALDAEELKRKVDPALRIQGPTYLKNAV